MWVDAYVNEVLIRQQIIEARQRAARAHLIRSVRSRPIRPGLWARLARLQRLIQSIAPVVWA